MARAFQAGAFQTSAFQIIAPYALEAAVATFSLGAVATSIDGPVTQDAERASIVVAAPGAAWAFAGAEQASAAVFSITGLAGELTVETGTSLTRTEIAVAAVGADWFAHTQYDAQPTSISVRSPEWYIARVRYWRPLPEGTGLWVEVAPDGAAGWSTIPTGAGLWTPVAAAPAGTWTNTGVGVTIHWDEITTSST